MTEQSFSLAAVLAGLAVFPLACLATRRVRRPKPVEPPVQPPSRALAAQWRRPAGKTGA